MLSRLMASKSPCKTPSLMILAVKVGTVSALTTWIKESRLALKKAHFTGLKYVEINFIYIVPFQYTIYLYCITISDMSLFYFDTSYEIYCMKNPLLLGLKSNNKGLSDELGHWFEMNWFGMMCNFWFYATGFMTVISIFSPYDHWYEYCYSLHRHCWVRLNTSRRLHSKPSPC